MIGLAIDLQGAELRQMIGQKLRVQQTKPACNQMRDQMDKGDFAGIARARKHTLAKEGSPKANPVKATDKLPLMPRLDTKAMPAAVQTVVKL